MSWKKMKKVVWYKYNVTHPKEDKVYIVLWQNEKKGVSWMIDVIKIQGAKYIFFLNHDWWWPHTHKLYKKTLSHYTSKPKDCSLPKYLCRKLPLNM